MLESLQYLLYVPLGVLYAAVFTSFGQHVLRYFDKEIPFDQHYWMVWGLWLVIPAVLCAFLEKVATLATLREHESLFDTGPVTSIIETVAQGVPAFFRGFLYAIPLILLNWAADAFLAKNLVREAIALLGLPMP
ncbi:hypothetical protein [Megalodesulfovibrio paquesii]